MPPNYLCRGVRRLLKQSLQLPSLSDALQNEPHSPGFARRESVSLTILAGAAQVAVSMEEAEQFLPQFLQR
jgi:hypothetical protein